MKPIFTWLTIACMAAGIWLASISHTGLEWSPDAMNYYAVARSLQSGTGLHTSILRRDVLNLDPVQTIWPPGYPAALAFVSAVTGQPLETAAVLLAGLQFVTIVLLLTLCVERLTGRRAVWWIGLASLLFAPFLSVSGFPWSEPLFLILVLVRSLCLMGLARGWLESGKVRWDLAAASGVLVGAAFLVRYATVPLFLSTAAFPVVMWMVGRNQSNLPRLRQAVSSGMVAGVASLVLSLPWVLYSFSITGRLGEQYTPSARGLGSLAGSVVTTAVTSFTESLFPIRVGIPRAVSLAAAALVLIAGFGLARRFRDTVKAPGERGLGGWQRMAAAFFAAEAIWYIIFYVLTAARNHMDPPDTRTLLPAAALLLMVLLAWGQSVVSDRGRQMLATVLGAWAITLCVAMTVTPGAQSMSADCPRGAASCEAYAWVRSNTADSDVVIAPHGWVYNRYLGRRILPLSAFPYAPHLTAEELGAWANLTQNTRGRMLLVIPGGVSREGWGPFVHALGAGTDYDVMPGYSLRPVANGTDFRVYQVDRP